MIVTEPIKHKTDFDYTMTADFLTCRRLYHYRHNLGYRLKRPATALSFGAAIGKALDSWYVDKDVKKAVEVFKGSYVEDLEVDDKRTHQMGEWILKNYHTHYQDAPIELIHTEMTFKQPLPNSNNWIGRVDKVIKWTGATLGLDHKTTSQLGAQFFNFAQPNLQFPGYMWALKKVGYDVNGFVVDAILVAKGLLPGKGKNNNLTPLLRDVFYYTPSMLNEWLESVLHIQADIKRCEESGVWCPNFNACVTKYGDCEYRRVCKEDGELRQRILDQDYVVEFWDPLAHTQTGV